MTEIKDGVVYFRLAHASAREIVGPWRKVGRRGTGPDDGLDMLDVVSKQQLSLPGSHT